jgi:hypothetical protein
MSGTLITAAMSRKQAVDGKFATENFALSLIRELQELSRWLGEVPEPFSATEDIFLSESFVVAKQCDQEYIRALREPLIEYLQRSLR